MNRTFLTALAIIVSVIFFSTILLAQQIPQKITKQKMSAVEKIKTAKKLLQEAKSELTRQGKYDCCIEEPCNQCALEHQSCPCSKDLKAGNPVCPECYAGWQQGEGKDKDIKPEDVKTKFSTHKH